MEIIDINDGWQLGNIITGLVPGVIPLNAYGSAADGIPSYPFRPDVLPVSQLGLSDSRYQRLSSDGFHLQRQAADDLSVICGNKRYKVRTVIVGPPHLHDANPPNDVLPSEGNTTTSTRSYLISGSSITVNSSVVSVGGEGNVGVVLSSTLISRTVSQDDEDSLVWEEIRHHTVGSGGYHEFTLTYDLQLTDELVYADLIDAFTTWFSSATPGSSSEGRAGRGESMNSGNLFAEACIWRCSITKYTTTPSAYTGSWPTFYNGKSKAWVRLVTRKNYPVAVSDRQNAFAYRPYATRYNMHAGSRFQTLSDECTGVCMDELGEFEWPEVTDYDSGPFTLEQAQAATAAAPWQPFAYEEIWFEYPFYSYEPVEIGFRSGNGVEYRIKLQFLEIDWYSYPDVSYIVYDEAILVTDPETYMATRCATPVPETVPYDSSTRIATIERKNSDGDWVLIASVDPADQLPDPQGMVLPAGSNQCANLYAMYRRRNAYAHGFAAFDSTPRRFRRKHFQCDQETPDYGTLSGPCGVGRPSGSLSISGYVEVIGHNQYHHALESYEKTFDGIDVRERYLVPDWISGPYYESRFTSLSIDAHARTFLGEFYSEDLGGEVSDYTATTITSSGTAPQSDTGPYSTRGDEPDPRGEVIQEQWIQLPAETDIGSVFATAIQNLLPPDVPGQTHFIEGFYTTFEND